VDDVVDCIGDSPLADVLVGGNSDEATENGLEPLSTYTVTVTGNRFLYKQVRFMVGSIVSVGLGNISLGYVRSALESERWEEEVGSADGKGKQKMQKILCAPSHGLCLTDVQFGHGIEFEWRV
jgi:tRNA U38,U39,U40 pseudouridine synthase TruA